MPGRAALSGMRGGSVVRRPERVPKPAGLQSGCRKRDASGSLRRSLRPRNQPLLPRRERDRDVLERRCMDARSSVRPGSLSAGRTTSAVSGRLLSGGESVRLRRSRSRAKLRRRGPLEFRSRLPHGNAVPDERAYRSRLRRVRGLERGGRECFRGNRRNVPRGRAVAVRFGQHVAAAVIVLRWGGLRGGAAGPELGRELRLLITGRAVFFLRPLCGACRPAVAPGLA